MPAYSVTHYVCKNLYHSSNVIAMILYTKHTWISNCFQGILDEPALSHPVTYTDSFTLLENTLEYQAENYTFFGIVSKYLNWYAALFVLVREYSGCDGIVLKVDGNNITIQDSNYDGITNTFEDAKSDWKTVTYTLDEYRNRLGGVVFANPK